MSKEYREKLANQSGGHNKVIAELRKIVELKVLKERALAPKQKRERSQILPILAKRNALKELCQKAKRL